MKLSIIIPVYNEKATIKELLTRVLKTQLPIESEILVIDDGSTDGTTQILKSQQERWPKIKFFFHKINLGKGAAVRTGLVNARGDIFLIQDADLEYNPEDYNRLLAPIITKKSSVVYGSRFIDLKLKLFGPDKTPFITHYFGNKFLNFLTNFFFGSSITDMETGYKVFTREVFKKLTLKASRFDLEPEITAQILKNGFKIHEVPISFKARSYQEGKKITWRDGLQALKVLLKYKFLKKQ